MNTWPRMPRAKFCLGCYICKTDKIEDMCTYDVNCTIPIVFIHAKISLARRASSRVGHRQKGGGKEREEAEKQKVERARIPHWLVSSRNDQNRGGMQACLEAIESISLLFHIGASSSVYNHSRGRYLIYFLFTPTSVLPHTMLPLFKPPVALWLE